MDIGKAIAGVVRSCLSYPHYSLTILSEMARKVDGLKLLKLHSTADGNRAVVSLDKDPNWLYEVTVRPRHRDELEPETSLFMLPKRK